MTFAGRRAAYGREVRFVFGDDAFHPITLDAIALYGRPQLDEIVGRRDTDDQIPTRREHPSGFSRIAARVQRHDERDARIENRQPAIGVGDDPGGVAKPPRRAIDCRHRQVDSDRPLMAPRRERSDQIP